MAEGIVAKIDRVVEIPNADRIHTAYVLGEQVVVSKVWGVGMEGIFFPAETQLSEEFCTYNNLYRHSEKNRDPEVKGFFDDNRRVRCQPFLKVKSEGYFTTLESLAWCGENHYMDLQIGDKLDTLNGHRVCEKYYSPQTIKAMANAKYGQTKKKAIETPMFHKHVKTDQFRHSLGLIQKGDLLSFHAKVHGTSARYSNTKIITEPSGFFQKLLDKVGLYQRERWDYVAGTRNVVLYCGKDENKEGYNGSEAYRFEVLEMLKPHLEKGITVYGEIAGFANGSPIMGKHETKALKDKAFKNKYGNTMVYTYGCNEASYRFHVYRVTMTNDDGTEVDFTDAQVMAWCEQRGLLPPLAVHEPIVYDGDHESLATLVEQLTERPEVLTEDYIDPRHVSEGIIIRADGHGLTPKFLKSKSYAFKVMEGIFKEDNIDLEDAS